MATAVKVCDVRDYATAVMCAALGVDYIGLHCINRIKPERVGNLRRICREIPGEHAGLRTVMVTQVVDVGRVAQMLSELSPTHVQLHSRSWNGDQLRELREAIKAADLGKVGIIAVTVPGEPTEKVDDLSHAADMVLVDRHYYENQPGGTEPEIDDYLPLVRSIRRLGKFAFVGGGLTVGNVDEYIGRLQPDGVDVQTGVEVPGREGRKDRGKLGAFLKAVRRSSVEPSER